MSEAVDIFSSIEANAIAAKGPLFTGWYQHEQGAREYFIGGTAAKRIASWLNRPTKLEAKIPQVLGVQQ